MILFFSDSVMVIYFALVIAMFISHEPPGLEREFGIDSFLLVTAADGSLSFGVGEVTIPKLRKCGQNAVCHQSVNIQPYFSCKHLFFTLLNYESYCIRGGEERTHVNPEAAT